jgi:N-methylhydantoinase B/oxoprolinase/acetone carboxylase alpha subunit
MLSANLLAAAAQAFMQCIIRAGYLTRHEYMALPIGWIGTLYAYAGLDQYQRMTTGFANNMYNSAAGGACSVGDGIDSMGVLVGITADSLDIEHDEIQHPFIYAFRRLAHDQAGAGKYRGGAGGASGVYVHDSASLYGQIISLPHSFPINTGIYGGYAASCGPGVKVNNGGSQPLADPAIVPPVNLQQMASAEHGGQDYELASTLPFRPMAEGDGFGARGPGGGGWGDALERRVETRPTPSEPRAL